MAISIKLVEYDRLKLLADAFCVGSAIPHEGSLREAYDEHRRQRGFGEGCVHGSTACNCHRSE